MGPEPSFTFRDFLLIAGIVVSASVASATLYWLFREGYIRIRPRRRPDEDDDFEPTQSERRRRPPPRDWR